MSGIEINLFSIPKEVIYYVVFPLIIIVIAYFGFNLFYHKKKGQYYYNYVVDYVYSTLGIVVCSLLLCLILGYSIATIKLLIVNRIINNYIPMACALVILPFIPLAFLISLIRIYLRNLKRKELLDRNLEYSNKLNNEKLEKTKKLDTNENTVVDAVNDNVNENFQKKPQNLYEDVDLVKKSV